MYGTHPTNSETLEAATQEGVTSEDREILATIGELTDENRELVKSMLRTMLAQQRANRSG